MDVGGRERYRRWYRRLLGFYPRPYRDRFAESMEQTFADIVRERAPAGGRGFVTLLLWVFVETLAGIVRQRATNLVRFAVAHSTDLLKLVKYSAAIVGVLMVAGIVVLMILARGTGEDITGIVAPAVLITLLSAVAAVVAAVLQGASKRRRRKAGEDVAG
jgi:hypothetical protein